MIELTVLRHMGVQSIFIMSSILLIRCQLLSAQRISRVSLPCPIHIEKWKLLSYRDLTALTSSRNQNPGHTYRFCLAKMNLVYVDHARLWKAWKCYDIERSK